MERIPIEQLKPAPYNPRKDLAPGDSEYEKLKRSIVEFGCVQSIVWNKSTGYVVGGHQTLKVLSELGHTEVNCAVVELTLAQEKALNIALNKISGEWNDDKLAKLLEDISLGDLDVTITGFDMKEIDNLISDLNMTELEDDEFDSEETTNNIVPISEEGDLWLLGNHRLVCGDSTKEKDITRLMNGKLARLIITDPPYNVDYEGSKGMKIKNDNMENDDFYEFLLSSLKHMFSHAEEGAPAYVFHADSEAVNFRRAFTDAGFYMAQCLVWVKNTLVLGRQDYHWRHEPIIYGWKPGAAHHWYGQRDKTTVIECNKPSKSELHPTMKPLEILGKFLQHSSREGDLVLDPFAGSGSTLIACDQLGRICYSVELDKLYCDVIVQRYITYKGTDEDVHLVRNGNKYSFADIKGDGYG